MEPIRFGKFMLLEQIASGGMAEIYKAVGITAGGQPQTIAIKRILPQYSGDEDFISLLIDEAKLMVFLNHPNIVPIIEFGKVEDSYYIAMDYVEGTTLKGLIKRVQDERQPFTIDMACHIVREIGAGLAYAHRKTDRNGRPMQIVHRDISPANILISYDGDVKIADFGISKAATQGHRTQIGVIRGKTGYMSPEQTRAGDLIDQRSDLYSLGIIFWELLTGERLYLADSIPEALRMIRKSRPPAPSSRRPQVPATLDAIVGKSLFADPGDRYQNGEEMIDAINEFLGRFAPGGRPVRVTHGDLSGFLRRYFAAEMTAVRKASPIELDRMITRVESPTHSTSLFPARSKQGVRPETIAQNPLFEMSSPEQTLSQGPSGTVPSASTSEPTIPDATGSLLDAPEGVSRKPGRRNPLAWGVVILLSFGLAVGSAYLFLWRRAPVAPPVETTRGTASVDIRCDPSGAEILLDGLLHPLKAPAIVDVPAGRNVKVTLRKPGFVSQMKEIRPEGSGITLRFNLDRDRSSAAHSGKVRIMTDPSGALVRIDGKRVPGGTPVEFDIPLKRKVTVRVEAEGFLPKETVIRMEEPEKIEKSLVLAPLPVESAPRKPKVSSIEVEPPPRLGPEKSASPVPRFGKLSVATSNPNWSQVFIDGKKSFVAPTIRWPLSPGRHRIRLANDDLGAESHEMTVTIVADQELRICFDFETRKEGCR